MTPTLKAGTLTAQSHVQSRTAKLVARINPEWSGLEGNRGLYEKNLAARARVRREITAQKKHDAVRLEVMRFLTKPRTYSEVYEKGWVLVLLHLCIAHQVETLNDGKYRLNAAGIEAGKQIKAVLDV